MKGTLILLFISSCVSAYSQENQFKPFENLLGKSWVAEGHWGDGSPFYQEVRFEYALEEQLILVKSRGFIDEQSTLIGDRNLGIRKIDPESGNMLFWEYDTFGGTTSGKVSTDEASIFYTYQYGDFTLRDTWEFMNDSTYTYRVQTIENGKPASTFLETRFEVADELAIATDISIHSSKVIPSSREEAWSLWTTREGLRSFFGVDNSVSIRPGGFYEIYMDESRPYGLRGSEGSQVLSFIPQEMLSFTWNAPPSIPSVRNHEHKSWVVLTFTEVSSDETRVDLVHTGFLSGADWEKTYEYFSEAWPFVLENMQRAVQEE